MPQFIPVIIYYAAQYFAASSVWAAVAAAVASYAVSAHKAEEARKRARRAYNASLTDRGVMIRSGVAPRQMVVGRAKVSGPLIYATSTGAKKEYLHLVVCLAAHEIDAVETIYFNDVALPAADGSGNITSGEFSKADYESETYVVTDADGNFNLPHTPSSVESVVMADVGEAIGNLVDPSDYTVTGANIELDTPPGGSRVYTVNYTRVASSTPLVRIKVHRGQAGQTADADLVSESGGEWTSSHRGDGIAYLYVRLKYDQDVFGAVGVPNISAVVRGAKCYDPRTTTTVWTQNSALITRWWLRQQEIGMKQPLSSIPDSEVAAAANICDEDVDLDAGGTITQKRYTTNGTLSAEDSLRSNLEQLVVPMAGSATFVQGKWRIRAGAHEAPDVYLNESHFAQGAIETLPYAPRRELFNAVTGTYIDAESGHIERQFPLVENATYQAADGGEQITRNVIMPMVDDAVRAQRLSKIMIERARQAETIQATFKLSAYNVKPNDVVALTDASVGWTNKLFVVRDRAYLRNEADRVRLTLQATAAGVWDWAYGEATTVDLAPNTDLPAPGQRPALLGTVAVDTGPEHMVRLQDGTEVIRGYVTWDAAAEVWVQQGGRIEIEHKRDDATTWTADAPVPGIATSGYAAPLDRLRINLVRVRAVNVLGLAGPWATVVVSTVEGDDTPISDVDAVVAVVAGARASMTWAKPPEADWDFTQLHRGSWASPDEVLIVRGTTTTWTAPGAGTFLWYAKHRDRSGNYSAGTAGVSVTTNTGERDVMPDVNRFAWTVDNFPDNCNGGLRLNRDGSMSAMDQDGAWGANGQWFSHTDVSTVGDGYYCMFVQRSGSAPDGGDALDTWHQLNTARSITHAKAGPGDEAAAYDVYIATDASGSTIKSVSVWNFLLKVLP